MGMVKMMKSLSTWEKERNGFSDLLLKSSFLIVDQNDREHGDLQAQGQASGPRSWSLTSSPWTSRPNNS